MSGGGHSTTTYNWPLEDAVKLAGRGNFGWWKCAHCGANNPFIKDGKDVGKCTQCGAPPK